MPGARATVAVFTGTAIGPCFADAIET